MMLYKYIRCLKIILTPQNVRLSWSYVFNNKKILYNIILLLFNIIFFFLNNKYLPYYNINNIWYMSVYNSS